MHMCGAPRVVSLQPIIVKQRGMFEGVVQFLGHLGVNTGDPVREEAWRQWLGVHCNLLCFQPLHVCMAHVSTKLWQEVHSLFLSSLDW